MNTHQSVQRDERTVAVENVAYKWAYSFITFALLIDVACRAAIRHEAAWDLMVLIVAGGAVCTIFQARQKTLARGWFKATVLVAFVGAIVAFVIAAILTMTKAT